MASAAESGLSQWRLLNTLQYTQAKAEKWSLHLLDWALLQTAGESVVSKQIGLVIPAEHRTRQQQIITERFRSLQSPTRRALFQRSAGVHKTHTNRQLAGFKGRNTKHAIELHIFVPQNLHLNLTHAVADGFVTIRTYH